MVRLRIQPHGRLQEWVAHENGYFRAEGLDYEFKLVRPDERRDASGDVLSGAYELYEEGQGSKGSELCDVSSACHWAVNEASSTRLGRMWRHAYAVTPSGIYVPPESPHARPEDLAGVEIAAGYHSGSHFASLQGLETFLPKDQIALRFIGRPMARLEAALERAVPAVSVWGMARDVLEQHGFRRLLDSTFMVGFLFSERVDVASIEMFMRALKQAQAAIDLTPERYKHFYSKELPEHLRDNVDVRLFGTGERIVFLPYSDQMYRDTRTWIRERALFEAPASRATTDVPGDESDRTAESDRV